MRVARLHGPGDVRLSDEPQPVPRAGEELVRVTAVGLCGSDLHWFAEGAIGDARLRRPLVIGHEFAGTIEGGPRHGQLVAVDPAIPCGRCAECSQGHGNLCPTVVFAGHGDQDGALREFVTWPGDRCHAVPGDLSPADAAMLEPLGVALHAVDLCRIRVGDAVAVIGCGPIGLLVIQLARAAGAARVLAVDPLPHRRQAATSAGADTALTPTDEAVAQHDAGADVVFEVCGSDQAIDLALRAARPGRRVALIGIPDGDRTTITASTARRKGLVLVMVRRMGEMYPRAIAAVGRGAVDVTSLVTARFPLGQVAEAFATARDRTGLKILVEPDRS